MSEKKQPDIRFQGLHGDWEKKEFLNAFDTSIPTNTLSRANLNYEQGAVKNIHYGDVLIKFGEITDILKEEIPFITNADITKYKNHFLENGDIIFADAAEDETVGKATEISGITDEKVVSGLHTIACRPIESTSTGYWGYYLNSSAYHNQLLSLMQGIKVLSISKRSLATTFVNYPEEENEQIKIGELFKELDNLIALNQSKYDKLISMKKACLEKMFPKDGADTPEIRFKGFSGKWNRSKLEEVTIKIGDGLHGTPSYSESGNVLFVNGNNFIQGKIVCTEDTKCVTEQEQSIDDKSLNENTILMSINGTIGNLAFYNGEKVMLGKSAAYIMVKNLDKKFLYSYLQTTIIMNHFMNSLTGTTIKNLGLKTIRETEIYTPYIDEQTPIGNFFENLDNLIVLRKTGLETLKNIKKALLEKMFI